MVSRKRKLKRLFHEPAVLIGFAVLFAVIAFFLFMKFISGNGGSGLQTIRNRGTVRVGVREDIAPFGYMDSHGSRTGFEVELGELLANEMLEDGFAEYKTVQQKTKESYLNYGYVDILIAMAETESEAYLSTEPYYLDPVVLLAMQAFTLENTDAITVATVLSSSSESILETYLEENGFDLVQVQTFPSVPDALDALRAGKVTAVCYEESTLQILKEDSMNFYGPQIGEIAYGIAVPSEDTVLLQAVQQAFDRLKENGKLDALYEKYQLVSP